MKSGFPLIFWLINGRIQSGSRAGSGSKQIITDPDPELWIYAL
jgi:hypothetical protein